VVIHRTVINVLEMIPSKYASGSRMSSSCEFAAASIPSLTLGGTSCASHKPLLFVSISGSPQPQMPGDVHLFGSVGHASLQSNTPSLSESISITVTVAVHVCIDPPMSAVSVTV